MENDSGSNVLGPVKKMVHSQRWSHEFALASLLESATYHILTSLGNAIVQSAGEELMNCPACKGVVVIVEYEKIELDYCTRCAGVWFDEGELELLADRLSLDGAGLTPGEISALPEKDTHEKRRRCPICARRMRKVVLGTDPEVIVDICPVGDGIWFDGGEVIQVLGQLKCRLSPAGGTGRVISFLGEVFQAAA